VADAAYLDENASYSHYIDDNDSYLHLRYSGANASENDSHLHYVGSRVGRRWRGKFSPNSVPWGLSNLFPNRPQVFQCCSAAAAACAAADQLAQIIELSVKLGIK